MGYFKIILTFYKKKDIISFQFSGCSAVWLAHLVWDQGVGGSNPLIPTILVGVAQLVRASGCGSEGRGFDSHHSPHVIRYVSVAQLDRATDFGSVGCGFDSCRTHQIML